MAAASAVRHRWRHCHIRSL